MPSLGNVFEWLRGLMIARSLRSKILSQVLAHPLDAESLEHSTFKYSCLFIDCGQNNPDPNGLLSAANLALIEFSLSLSSTFVVPLFNGKPVPLEQFRDTPFFTALSAKYPRDAYNKYSNSPLVTAAQDSVGPNALLSTVLSLTTIFGAIGKLCATWVISPDNAALLSNSKSEALTETQEWQKLLQLFLATSGEKKDPSVVNKFLMYLEKCELTDTDDIAKFWSTMSNYIQAINLDDHTSAAHKYEALMYIFNLAAKWHELQHALRRSASKAKQTLTRQEKHDIESMMENDPTKLRNLATAKHWWQNWQTMFLKLPELAPLIFDKNICWKLLTLFSTKDISTADQSPLQQEQQQQYESDRWWRLFQENNTELVRLFYSPSRTLELDQGIDLSASVKSPLSPALSSGASYQKIDSALATAQESLAIELPPLPASPIAKAISSPTGSPMQPVPLPASGFLLNGVPAHLAGTSVLPSAAAQGIEGTSFSYQQSNVNQNGIRRSASAMWPSTSGENGRKMLSRQSASTSQLGCKQQIHTSNAQQISPQGTCTPVM